MNQLPRSGPWASRSEFLIDQALDNALAASPDELRVMRPAAAPTVLFPPRTGYRSEQWDLNMVLSIDRVTPSNRSWVSGMPVEQRNISDAMGMINGSSRNAYSEQWR